MGMLRPGAQTKKLDTISAVSAPRLVLFLSEATTSEYIACVDGSPEIQVVLLSVRLQLDGRDLDYSSVVFVPVVSC